MPLRLPTVSAVALIAALAAAACAEPQVPTAHVGADTELTSERRESPPQPARAAEDDARQRAAILAAARAELEKNDTGVPTAGGAAPPQAGGTAIDADAAAPGSPAAAATDVERRDYDAKARGRLAAIDTRANDVRARSGKLTATRKTEFETTWKRFSVERNEVETKLTALARATNESFGAARSNVERAIAQLESTLAKLDDNL